MTVATTRAGSGRAPAYRPEPMLAPSCCPLYHEAVELVGRRWTGALVEVLLQRSPLRFSEIAQAVPDISDRLLSERLKELEARGLVARAGTGEHSARAGYALTAMGRALGPALGELKAWAQHWMTDPDQHCESLAQASRLPVV